MQHMVKPIKLDSHYFIRIIDIMTLSMYKIIFNNSGDAIKPYIISVKGIQDLYGKNQCYIVVASCRNFISTLMKKPQF